MEPTGVFPWASATGWTTVTLHFQRRVTLGRDHCGADSILEGGGRRPIGRRDALSGVLVRGGEDRRVGLLGAF